MSDDEGYDYEVVGDTFNDLFCTICLKLMRNAVQLPCGHGMCKPCLDGLERSSISRSMQYMCPICRKAISNEKVFDNKMLNRVILAVKVKCKYAEEQCDWIGQIDGIKDHLSRTCKFEEVDCTNTGCNVKIKRHELIGHISTCDFRLCPCEYCNEMFQFHKLNVHYEICSGCPIYCPNGCPTQLLRKQLNEHLKECLNGLVQCDYHDVGCNIKIMRGVYSKHLQDDMQNHLLLTQRQLLQTMQKMIVLEVDLKEVKDEKNARMKKETEYYSAIVVQKVNIHVDKFNTDFDKYVCEIKTIFRKFDDKLSIFCDKLEKLQFQINTLQVDLDEKRITNIIGDQISTMKGNTFLSLSSWHDIDKSARQQIDQILMFVKLKVADFGVYKEHNILFDTRFNSMFYTLECDKIYKVESGADVMKLNLNVGKNDWFTWKVSGNELKLNIRLSYPIHCRHIYSKKQKQFLDMGYIVDLEQKECIIGNCVLIKYQFPI